MAFHPRAWRALAVTFLVGAALAGAEIRLEAGASGSTESPSFPVGPCAGVGFSAQGTLDDAWAAKLSASAEGSWSGTLSAVSELSGAVSLREGECSWIAKYEQAVSASDATVRFDGGTASVGAVIGVGLDALGCLARFGYDGLSAMPGLETGVDAWYEFAAGPFVLAPGAGFGVLWRDAGGVGMVFRPGLKVSVFPDIPAYLEAKARIATDFSELGVGGTLAGAWVPADWIQFHVRYDVSFFAGELTNFLESGIELSVLRSAGIELSVPVDCAWDFGGILSLSCRARFTLE